MLNLENGVQVPVRILIDQGSELSFISEELVHRLHLKRTQAYIPLLGIGGTYSGKTRGIVQINLQSIHDASSTRIIFAYILQRLTTKLSSFRVKEINCSHFQGLPLADPDFLKSAPIDIIIGADYYGLVIESDLIKGSSSSPSAQRSIFGWIIYGPISTQTTDPIQGFHCSQDQNLLHLLSRFWTQEELGTSAGESLSPDEAICESHYVNTFYREESGRYVVRLPLKLSAKELGDSTKAAERSLIRLSLIDLTPILFFNKDIMSL